jgi:hypothetical protein
VGQQIQQEGVFAGGRVLDQLDQVGDLLGIQRQRGMPSAARSATWSR